MNLVKKLEESKAVVMNLAKGAKLGSQRAEVQFIIDTSGSMSGAFANGNVQTILERVFPICMAFDDDGLMPSYEMSNDTKRIGEDVSISNVANYVKEKMHPAWGGTQYAPAIKRIVADYKASIGGTGLISKLFGAKTSDKPKIPVYVVFITDGNCGDPGETTRAMIEAANYPIFFQFIGLSTGYSSTFEFLKTIDTMIGRKFDNANMFEFSLAQFTEKTSDQDLYGKMLFEFPSAVKDMINLDLID